VEHDAFAVSAPGLESTVAGELTALGLKDCEPVDGGVEFKATKRQLYAANLHLRTASRVLVRLVRFRALTFAELEKRARRILWELVIAPGQPVALRVTCRKSRLYHSGAVAERIQRDLVQRFRAEVRPVSPDEDVADPQNVASQLIIVRFDHDHCTVSADSSGPLLHQRGYRLSVTQAPMRETLAAALVLASGWDQASPLLDPFCGSGTIPIEACLIATRVAPGKNRNFQFMQWPGFDQAAWRRVHAEAVKQERRETPVIRGSDETARAIRAATENADRAGVAGRVALEKADALKIEPGADSGWIVSNPPYGIRLGDERRSRYLLRDFAERMRNEFGGWRFALLAPDSIASIPGLKLSNVIATTNGGLRVHMLVGSVPVKRQPSTTKPTAIP
jgi:putative N6-adenine-specific DNA methylase